MRLQIQIDAKSAVIPYEYHGFLQAALYKALNKNYANFYHDKGYGNENRLFKLFVFSEFVGRYEPTKEGIQFLNKPSFFVASVDPDFLNQIYSYYADSKKLILGKQVFEISKIGPVKDLVYNKSQEYNIRTISPVCCYKTDGKRFRTYYNPKSEDFEIGIRENLRKKALALDLDPSEEFFEIIKVENSRESFVKYKKNTILGYSFKARIHVSDMYWRLLLETGMGAKNSAGFGMIQRIDEGEV